MTKIPKLCDLQLILLSTAAKRDDGNIFPAVDSIAANEDRIRKTIPQLLGRGLIQEVLIKDRRPAWREGNDQSIGLVITDAGRTAIGVGDGGSASGAAAEPAKKADPAARSGPTKAGTVLELLRRPGGATLNELVDATGWLPHTTRAALTGLRKKGHVLEKTRREDATCYRIAEVA